MARQTQSSLTSSSRVRTWLARSPSSSEIKSSRSNRTRVQIFRRGEATLLRVRKVKTQSKIIRRRRKKKSSLLQTLTKRWRRYKASYSVHCWRKIMRWRTCSWLRSWKSCRTNSSRTNAKSICLRMGRLPTSSIPSLARMECLNLSNTFASSISKRP
jgi:hypothetical protein